MADDRNRVSEDGMSFEQRSAANGTAEAPDSLDASLHDVLLRDVCHFYGRNQVLTDVSLQVRNGEFFGFLGPSGSGKSTTLRIIGGFVLPTSGEVYVEGNLMGTTPPYRRNTTMVFQHLALFPHMTVFDNLGYGLKIRRRPKAEIKEKVARALSTVQLSGLEGRYPKQLSGGQQQRVALARALILEPGVVLFDEPLGSLDLKLRREMQIEVKNLQHRLGTTFVYVTHDQQEALTMCDRIAIMDQGRVEQVGTAEEIYERPATRFVADFVGDTNFLDGTISSRDGIRVIVQAGGLSIPAWDDHGRVPGEVVALSIRPERILMGADAAGCDTAWPARIVDVIYTGATRRIIVVLPGDARLKIDADARTVSEAHIGDEVQIGWQSDESYLVAR